MLQVEPPYFERYTITKLIKGTFIKIPTEFYLMPEELFRLGNSNDSQLSKVRSRDIDLIAIDTKKIVIANGKGISLFDLHGIKLSPMSGWVWKFPLNTEVPPGLKLVKDKEHHYCISPAHNILLKEYKRLLEVLALKGTRYFKKEERKV